MKKRFLIALVLLLLLTTYNSQNNFNLNLRFNIEQILIENNTILKKDEIKKNLSFLYKKNIFSVNPKNVSEVLISNDSFIESFELKKIYPNKIRIKVFEKNPVAIIQNKKKKILLY
jgi:cell division septal protein FtsQ